MMTHLHVKSTEPKAAPQPVSTVPTRGNDLVAFLLRLLGQMWMPKPFPHLVLLAFDGEDQKEARPRQRPGITRA